jgi:prephenate dehydrogenase
MRWRKVTLIGVGLLGGSLGLALRKRAFAGQVWGYVRRESSIQECLRAGAVDHATVDLSVAVQGADLVILCTPLFQMPELSREIGRHISQGALVTDVGSVKGPLVAQLEPLFAARGAFFVGSHPMAGSEKMGVAAAREDLFSNAICVVTPTKYSDPGKVTETESLWSTVGSRVLRLSPELHDQFVARSSHLPHLLAAQLAAFVLDSANAPEQGKLCANGFRDTTRIASGSPEMWRDIVLMNRSEVLVALDQFADRLQAFRAVLEKGDSAAIEDFFGTAKKLRDEWTSRCASSSPE